MTPGGGEPGVPSAEAAADGEDRASPIRAEVLDCGGHVSLNSCGRRLLDVLHVLEVVVALRSTRGAAEVVERHRRDPTLGEAQRELLVEAVEASDVREDHDTDLGGTVRSRREGGEAVAVSRLEDEVLMRDGGTADHGDRRDGVELEAHGLHEPSGRRKTPGSRSPEWG